MDCGKTKFETQNISEEEYSEKMKDEQIDPYPIKMINPEIISLGENLEEREEVACPYLDTMQKSKDHHP